MRIRYMAAVLAVLAVGACKDATRPDLNNPSVTDFSTITNLSQVQALAIGVLNGDRAQIGNEILYGETIGRDGYRLTGSEPRTVTELLGEAIDPSDFLGAALWPYAAVRLANIGVHGVENAPATVLSAEQQQASLGYLKTMKAQLFLRIIESHDTAGAPIDVDIDPTLPPAPMRCAADVRLYIQALLDSAATNLEAGGSDFPFSLPPGFAGFDHPGTFLTFNRALAAKNDVALAFQHYASSATIDGSQLTAASAALAASFLDEDPAQFNTGPKHDFSTNSGDATNPLFEDPGTTVYRANPRVVSEADAGDTRVSAKVHNGSATTVGGITSSLIFFVYTSPSSEIPIITDKELILLEAEVLWGQGQYPQALAKSNIIRTNDGGLSASGASGADAVLNEILKQKRYSLLWQSPDRWLDMRMFGKLTGDAPPVGVGQERGFDPIPNFPIPFNETSARSGDLSLTCSSAG